MKILMAILICLVGYSALANDEEIKNLQADIARQSSAQEQVIALTRKNLSLEIEHRKATEKIAELNQALIELAKEKKDIEVELADAEKDIARLEKANEVLENESQVIKATMVKIRQFLNSIPNN